MAILIVFIIIVVHHDRCDERLAESRRERDERVAEERALHDLQLVRACLHVRRVDPRLCLI